MPGFSWGRLRLVFGGVGAEVEVEGMATAAWVDRLRSPAWERGLVFLAGSAGAVAWGKYYIFFSWMKRNKNSRLYRDIVLILTIKWFATANLLNVSIYAGKWFAPPVLTSYASSGQAQATSYCV